MKKTAIILVLLTGILSISAQETFYPSDNQFRQMGTNFSSPNAYRAASGAPGHLYWQQQANYKITLRLDDEEHKIFGEEEIEYINNSPDALNYLWIQLDQNVRQKGNLGSKSASLSLDGPYASYKIAKYMKEFDGGFNIDYVTDKEGENLPVTVNYTMMRVDLPQALEPGEKTYLKIKWGYNINDRQKDDGGRSGMEYFSEENNYLYTIAQFFPRMAVYSDVEGWQNTQFTGQSEFALAFGDYQVEITVPADHVVGATGILLNPDEVLTDGQYDRYKEAHKSTDKVVAIVTEAEALKAEKGKSKAFKTWKFKAENVRDFAFASSRKFIWDAMAVKFGERSVLATSLYPKEGNPLWEKYSTRAVAHTLEVYSRLTFDYPYPVAYSVHTDRIGMEYPMMAFNGGRPHKDGTYSERTKWSMIGVIIHEVGHNYFPMIVNSDERQWTWMDEGLNTFLQGIAEREWDHEHPYPKGKPSGIVDYMKGDQTGIAPIMTNGNLLVDFYSNAYIKPAVGLNILRETIMGRELFDFAFKEYAQRWMFKHPTPEDFFRTMEDASAVDLDWFWRGWFYTTDYVDISLDGVTEYTKARGNPADDKNLSKQEEPEELAVQRNRESLESVVEVDPSMRDFYDTYDPDKDLSSRSPEQKAKLVSGEYYYQLDFSNLGGLVMPLVIEFTFDDGQTLIERVPAEIWSKNNLKTSKVFRFEKKVAEVALDPFLETADCDIENNQWPLKIRQNRFDLYKGSSSRRRGSSSNPMQNQ